MHRRESEWFAHGHQNDPAYRSVRLHVVASHPADTPQQLPIPTICLPPDSERAALNDGDDVNAPIDKRELSLELAGASWRRLLRRVSGFTEAVIADGRDGFRRHLLDRLFDALGYSSNREPMRALADALWNKRDTMSTKRDIISFLFDRAGLRPASLVVLERFLGERHRDRRDEPITGLDWDYAVRPGSAPELRLLAAAMLAPEIVSGRLIREARDRIGSDDAVGALRKVLIERIDKNVLLGIGRRDEMIVNVIIPAVIASAISQGDAVLIERTCRLYRRYPSLNSNRVIRSIERRWNGGRGISGAFFQQGAIELHQNYFPTPR